MNQISTITGTEIAIKTIEQWAKDGVSLAANHKQLMWKIAEWMQFGVVEFGDAAQQIALETFSKSHGDIKKAMDVSKRFSPDQRRPELTFTHHAVVMPLDDKQAGEVLDYAVENKASLTAIKKAVNAIRESEGGDVFAQMAAISYEELLDDWTGQISRIWNRAPSQEAREQFLETVEEFNNELIIDDYKGGFTRG